MSKNTKDCEIAMPDHYVDMTKDEMEYGGGFWHAFSAACMVVGFACTAASHSKIVPKKYRKAVLAVGVTCTVIGSVSLTCGLYSAATNAAFGTMDGASLVVDIAATPIDICSYIVH